MKIILGGALIMLAAGATPAAQGETVIGISKAVAIAEKALSAQAVEADRDMKSGQPIYEIDLVRGDHLYEATVDARTGKLLATNHRRLESLWARWFDKERLVRPTVSMSAMLAALEAETGGRVEEASLETEGGRAVYEVELTTQAGTAEFAVDPATGKRLPATLAD